MNILIVQTGEPLHIDGGDPRPMRAMNLAEALLKSGYSVHIISSAFYHQEKRHRYRQQKTITTNDNFKTTLIPSPGYKSHIGIGRLIDHFILGCRVRKFLKQYKEDVSLMFIGYPPIEIGYFAQKWSSKNNIPSILDVKDLWPDIFLDKIPNFFKPVFKLLLFPYFYLSRWTINRATAFTTMSSGYMKWLESVSSRNITNYDLVSGLASPDPDSISHDSVREGLNWLSEKHNIDVSHKMRFIFVGSFMSVFNFDPIRLVLEVLYEKTSSFEVIICGRGPYENDIKESLGNKLNVKFIGWLEYTKIVALAKISTAAIIPYKNIQNFKINIPNKVVDALSLGLPIITTVDGEIRNLVEEKDIGVHINENNLNEAQYILFNLLTDHKYFSAMSARAKNIYKNNYTVSSVYNKLILTIKHIINSNNNK